MFEVGTGASYDGSRFARDGVVCVTINYRVGPEGFLYLARRRREPRPARPDRRARVGARQHRGLRRRPRQRHDLRRVGRRDERRHAAGHAPGRGPVPARHHPERGGGPRHPGRRPRCGSGATWRTRLGIEATRDAIATVPPDRLLLGRGGAQGRPARPPRPGPLGPRGHREHAARGSRWSTATCSPAHPIDRIAARRRRRRRRHGRLEHRRLEAVRGRQRLPRAGHRRDPGRSGDRPRVRDGGRLRAVGRGRGRLSRGLPGRQPRASCSRPSRPTGGAGSRPSAWPRPMRRRRSATYMYEFAWPSPASAAGSAPATRSRSAFVFDTLDLGPNQMLGPLLGGDPPQALADAMHRRLGRLRDHGRPGLAEVRPRPAGDDALRHRLAGRRRSSAVRAGAVERTALTGHRPAFQRLSAYDQHCLTVETPARPLHVGILAVLDGRALLDAIPRAGSASRTIRRRDRRPGRRMPELRRVVFRPGPLAGATALGRRSRVPDRPSRQRGRAAAARRRRGPAGARRAAHGPAAGSLPPAVADVVRDRAARTAGSACSSSSTTPSPTAWPRCAWSARCSSRR